MWKRSDVLCICDCRYCVSTTHSTPVHSELRHWIDTYNLSSTYFTIKASYIFNPLPKQIAVKEARTTTVVILDH